MRDELPPRRNPRERLFRHTLKFLIMFSACVYIYPRPAASETDPHTHFFIFSTEDHGEYDYRRSGRPSAQHCYWQRFKEQEETVLCQRKESDNRAVDSGRNRRRRVCKDRWVPNCRQNEWDLPEGASSQTESPERVLTTQDDMCIGTTGGTYKSLKRGSVKAQALKLSERLAQKGQHIFPLATLNSWTFSGCWERSKGKRRKEWDGEAELFESSNGGREVEEKPDRHPQRNQKFRGTRFLDRRSPFLSKLSKCLWCVCTPRSSNST